MVKSQEVVVYRIFVGDCVLEHLDLSAFLQHHCSCKYVFESHFFNWIILSTFRSQNYKLRWKTTTHYVCICKLCIRALTGRSNASSKFEKVTARFYDTFSRSNFFFQKFKVYAVTFEQTLCFVYKTFLQKMRQSTINRCVTSSTTKCMPSSFVNKIYLY